MTDVPRVNPRIGETYDWAQYRAEIYGDKPVDPRDLHNVLVWLRDLDLPHMVKKYTLMAWLDLAGIALRHWYVEMIGGD